ncbi:MAG TPA: hypothetical protein VGO62_22085 [Myxococcota bacterium]
MGDTDQLKTTAGTPPDAAALSEKETRLSHGIVDAPKGPDKAPEPVAKPKKAKAKAVAH